METVEQAIDRVKSANLAMQEAVFRSALAEAEMKAALESMKEAETELAHAKRILIGLAQEG